MLIKKRLFLGILFCCIASIGYLHTMQLSFTKMTDMTPNLSGSNIFSVHLKFEADHTFKNEHIWSYFYALVSLQGLKQNGEYFNKYKDLCESEPIRKKAFDFYTKLYEAVNSLCLNNKNLSLENAYVSQDLGRSSHTLCITFNYFIESSLVYKTLDEFFRHQYCVEKIGFRADKYFVYSNSDLHENYITISSVYEKENIKEFEKELAEDVKTKHEEFLCTIL